MALEDRTPEEQRVLEETQRALEAGGDPFGDDEELVREGYGATTSDADDGEADGGSGEGGDAGATDADAGGEGESGQAAAGEGGDEAGEQQSAQAGDQTAAGADGQAAAGQTAAAEQAPLDEEALEEIADPLQLRGQPTQFSAEAPKDFKEQRKALLAEKSAAMKKLMDGEIDAEQHAAEEERITDRLDELTRQQVRAETLQELNSQNAAAYQNRVIQSVIRSAKGQIDYATDLAAVKQFDTALQVLLSDKENAGKDYAELADQAHRTVAALRGVQLKSKGGPAAASAPAAAPAAANKEVPDRQPKGEQPVTLRGIPAAAQSQTGGGVIDTMKHLNGQAYEEAFARLTPAQKASLLDD